MFPSHDLLSLWSNHSRSCQVLQQKNLTQEISEMDLLGRFSAAVGKCKHPSSQAFMGLLVDMAEMHARKASDYGTDQDSFANVRSAVDFGVEAYKGALIRAGDKVARLKTYAQKGTLANEGVEDSMLDLACYALIALVLFREER